MLSFINIWNPYRFCKDLIDIRQLHFRKISPRILLHTNNVHCNRLQCTCRHSHMSGLYRSVSCVDNAAHKTHLDKHTLRCFLTFPETEAIFELKIIAYCFHISNLKSPSSSLTDNLQKCMENKTLFFFIRTHAYLTFAAILTDAVVADLVLTSLTSVSNRARTGKIPIRVV